MDHPRTVLHKYGLRSNKNLGQHFLFDDNILAALVNIAQITPADLVLEIGPGLGALTSHLAGSAGRVIAIELDHNLIHVLNEELGALENVKIIRADILDWLSDNLLPDNVKVVANLPYYITGAIIRVLLSAENKPQSMVLTVQNEVARRIVAEPGKMSLLGVFVQFYYRASLAMSIKAGSFWPRPQVDSAVVPLVRLPGRMDRTVDEEQLFTLIRTGFSHKRKKLVGNLARLGYQKAQIVASMKSAGVEPNSRAQMLSVDEWLRLYLALSAGVSPT